MPLLVDLHDKNWTWQHYLNSRALQQADNVRAQLQRNMEKFDLPLVSIDNETKLHQAVRESLVCGFFMQIAHKEGEKGGYMTVKDNQVSMRLHLRHPFRSQRLLVLGCTATPVLWLGHFTRVGHL